MTTTTHEHELSRRSFVKAGGALVVGFSLLGPGLARASAAADPHVFSSFGPADSNAIDSWVVVNPDNTVSTVFSSIAQPPPDEQALEQ